MHVLKGIAFKKPACPSFQPRPRYHDHLKFQPVAAMVRFTKGSLKSVTGNDLVTVQYLPDNAPRAALCFHHGLQEHIGRYHEIFTTIADSGIAVFSLNAVGHGDSGGERGFVPKFSDLVDDFEAVCKAAPSTKTLAGVPFFIAGHSLGGLVATVTCLRDQSRWKGLLISAPALDVEWTPVLKIQAAMGNILAAIIPKARMVPAVDPANLNRDPARVKEYVEDPLNTVGPVAVRTGNETLKAFRQLKERRREVSLPVYAHHGTQDKVTSLPATK